MVNHEAVNCEQVWGEISNYVDGEIDATLRSSMEDHFRTCKRCASVLAGTRNVVHIYGDERMLEMPVGFSRRLKKRLAQNLATTGRRVSTWSAWLVPVAAILLIAGGLKLANTFTFRRPAKSILAAPGHDIPPEMQVVVSDGSKVFHVAGCPFIHDKATQRTMTAKEAIKDGYVPCSRCLRQYLKTRLTHSSGQQVVAAIAASQAAEQEEEELSAVAH
jgi:methylphosphotriester-DNA--protein-cysteine methyltransferase